MEYMSMRTEATMKPAPLGSVSVPVEVVLGRTRLSLRDLASIGKGDVIELESIAGEPVELVAAGECVALGEVVVVDERFGIRITRVLDGDRGTAGDSHE
jgi:flagellar motor switch protein FliN/FliY